MPGSLRNNLEEEVRLTMNAPTIVDRIVISGTRPGFIMPGITVFPALQPGVSTRAILSVASAKADVRKIIFVECECGPSQSLAEVDWISDLAKSEPRLKAPLFMRPRKR